MVLKSKPIHRFIFLWSTMHMNLGNILWVRKPHESHTLKSTKIRNHMHLVSVVWKPTTFVQVQFQKFFWCQYISKCTLKHIAVIGYNVHFHCLYYQCSKPHDLNNCHIVSIARMLTLLHNNWYYDTTKSRQPLNCEDKKCFTDVNISEQWILVCIYGNIMLLMLL